MFCLYIFLTNQLYFTKIIIIPLALMASELIAQLALGLMSH